MEDGNIVDDNNIAVDAWKHATRIRTQSNFGMNGVKTKFAQCRALANKNRDLFFDIINKASFLKNEKLIKRAKKAFFIRALREQNVDILDLTAVEKVREYAGKLVEVIKASSAKTKETKASILSRNNEKKQRVFGTDFKKFIELSAQLTYLKIEVKNRFEEIMTRNSHIGIGNLHLDLA
ncbi:hypothetical protein AB6E06_22850 [Vibrio splendidus]